MRPLEEGDLVSIDISCYVDGHHGDCCGTFVAGQPTPEGMYEGVGVRGVCGMGSLQNLVWDDVMWRDLVWCLTISCIIC